MEITHLQVPDAFCFRPTQHTDQRGAFMEWFRQDDLAYLRGHEFDLRQANCSISAAGVVRGIHFADIPPGQAKYVTCVSGAVLDVVVDLRIGSPTFKAWDSVLLDDDSRSAVYLAEGLGHAFMALTDRATVVYLCSAAYTPGREHGIPPFDVDIRIDWPTTDREGKPLTPQLSPKDADAPSLEDARARGMLPTIGQARTFYQSLQSAATPSPTN